MNLESKFWNKGNKKTETDCWEWTAGLDKDGYGSFRGGKPHRVSFEIYHKRKILTGMCILHNCDNRRCVNPNHLREGTHKENMEDKLKRSRCSSKLTKEQVIQIRNYKGIKAYKEIAEEFGITDDTVYLVMNKKTWAHI